MQRNFQPVFHVVFIFAGNHYGTPKPSKESTSNSTAVIDGGAETASSALPSSSSTQQTSVSTVISNFNAAAAAAAAAVANTNFPGAHPSSEGKRRRNRSNVEAMTAKNFQDEREGPSNGKTHKRPPFVEFL